MKIQIILPNENDQHIAEFPYNIAYILGKIILKLANSKIKFEHIKKFTHAKVLIADNQTLVGSHNLSSITIWTGVKEFSAKIEDERFLDRVLEFVDGLR